MEVVSRQKSVGSQKYWNSYFKEKWNLTLTTNTDTGVDTSTNNYKLILVTGHRRENFGKGFKNMGSFVKKLK